MSQGIIELTSLVPNIQFTILYHHQIDGKDYFSLKSENNRTTYFTFQKLENISINNVVYNTAEELINAFNAEFGTESMYNLKLDKDGYTGTAKTLDDRLLALEGSPLFNKIINATGFTEVGNTKTLNADWFWEINNVVYSNSNPIPFVIQLAASGLSRIDRIILGPNNFPYRQQGIESVNPQLQALPEDLLEAALILVTDSSVGTPSDPLVGDVFVKKIESFYVNAMPVGTSFTINTESSFFNIIEGSTDVLQYVENQLFSRLGKRYVFKNKKTTNITFSHLPNSSGNNRKYFTFSNGQDFILKPDEQIEFVENQNGKLDFLGIITDVDLTNYYNKTEIDAKIASVYKFKGNVADFDSLPTVDLTIGDVYNALDTGDNYAWTGTVWDKLAGTVDVSGKLDTGGYSGDAQDLKNEIDAIFVPNQLISAVTPTRSVNTFTYAANQYSALINKTVRTNPAQFITTITAAATDFKRVDLIYFKPDNTLAKIVGTESLTVAVRPDVPADSVAVSFINVFGAVISDPTPITQEISIQDFTGVERFKISDYLRFKGISFDAAAKTLITDALAPLSAFLDVVNGNDATAVLENSSKPFKTIQALFTALPATTGETYTIYITGGTVNFTRRVTPRNLRWIAYTSTTLNFTNVLLDDGVTNATAVLNTGSVATWTFENENISIINNFSGIKYFGSSNNSSNIILKGTLSTLQWQSTNTANFLGSFIFAANSNFRIINLFDSPQNTAVLCGLGSVDVNITNYRVQYARTLFREPNLGTRAVITNIIQTGGTSALSLNLSTNTSEKIPSISISNITMNGTITPFAQIINFNGTISNDCNINFNGTSVISGKITGTNYHFSSYLNSLTRFENFSGKLGLLDVFINGKITFQNCNIETNTYLIGRGSDSTTPNIVEFIGVTTINQVDTTQNLFKTIGVDLGGAIRPISITINGSVITNASTYGVNTSYVYTSSTFKEKINEVVIRSKTDLVNKTLSSSTTYIIDGTITLLTGEFIQIPAGGLTIVGYGFDVSKIIKNVSGQSIFSSPAGNSGNFVTKDMLYNSGLGSVFNITDSDGSHAIEINDVNFEGCASLGTITNYRQFTGTTCGIYGCSDGFTLEGNWNGFKLTNTNAFSFGAAGTLIKKGSSTLFNNRMFLELNLSFPTGAKICDFQPSNFSSNKLLQVVNCLVKVNNIIDPNTTSATFPNITPFDPKSLFSNNLGLKNTFLEPYGLKNTNLLTFANDTDAATGGIAVGEVYIETSTGYFKTRLV